MIPELTHWESYYVIVGSSAAALTGLQFVVMTLVGEGTRVPTSMRTISAFGTPTVVHFCSVLLVSAILSAPWEALSGAGWAIIALGLAGIVYGILVIRRAHKQKEYQPDASDWMWYTGLPFAGYAALLVAGLSLRRDPEGWLFVIGMAALLLLFIGIHNAWDTVTYITVGHRDPEAPTKAPENPTAKPNA